MQAGISRVVPRPGPGGRMLRGRSTSKEGHPGRRGQRHPSSPAPLEKGVPGSVATPLSPHGLRVPRHRSPEPARLWLSSFPDDRGSACPQIVKEAAFVCRGRAQA